MRKINNLLLFLLWVGVISTAISRCWFSCEHINLIYYKISSTDFKIFPTIFIFAVTGIFSYGMLKCFAISLKSFNCACLPLLVLIPEWLLPLSFFSIIWMIMILSVTFYRFLGMLDFRYEAVRGMKKRIVIPVLSGIFCLVVAYGWYLQVRAVKVLYLSWADWGFFWNVVHNSLYGKFFYSNYHGLNHLFFHFSPALFLLAPVVWLLPGTTSYFLANSLLLASGGLMLYGLSRTLRCSRGEAFLLAMLYFLNPGIFNLNLANFYSFHEIHLIFPILFGALWAYEKKCFKTALGLFLLALMVKETVAVLWIGIGFLLLFRRRFRSGATLIVAGVVAFLLLAKVVMPAFAPPNDSGFFMLMRYEQLGGSIGEILLSPLIKPAAFWGSLFRPCCIYFVLILTLPLLLLLAVDPLMLIPAVLLITFACLQKSDQLQNIMLQYQCMPQVVLFIAVVYNYRKIKVGADQWLRWILLPGCRRVTGRRLAVISLCGCLLASLGCSLFFANTHISKNNLSKVLAQPDCTPVINEFKALISEKVPLLVSVRVAPQFCGRNEVFFHERDIDMCDYALLDMTDTITACDVSKLRNTLQKAKGFSAIKAKRFGNHFFVLLKRNAKKALPCPLIFPVKFPPKVKSFDIPLKDKNFSLKMIFVPNANKDIFLQLITVKAVDYDVIIRAKINGEFDSHILNWLYGNGAYPAFLSKPGQAFYMKVGVPKGFGQIRSVQAVLEKL